MALSAPTGYKVFDTFTRGVLAACVMNICVSTYQLGFVDSPISISMRVVRFLMEEDATACKQQNTRENRMAKYGKD